MGYQTSITLDPHLEAFIENELSSGRYLSASEVINAALLLLELEEAKNKYITDALVEGENSGFESNFDPKVHLQRLHSKYL
jgi:antitoxin ParD1/3/4